MVVVRKRVVDGKVYYYLEASERVGRRVVKREKYLGTRLPRNLDALKRGFFEETMTRTYAEFDRMRAAYSAQKRIVPPSMRKKDIGAFSVRFTYNTNRIEGSRLTLRETARLLEDNETPRGKPLDDAKEAEAHLKAFYEALEDGRDLSLGLLLRYHRMLFASTKAEIAGRLREHQVEISGSRFRPPLAVEVYPLLRAFFKWYGKSKGKLHPVELAALVHLRLVTIHPFADGNGRVSRLLMNKVLAARGYPMMDIPYESRMSYYNALERAQTKGDETLFLRWFYRWYGRWNERYRDG